MKYASIRGLILVAAVVSLTAPIATAQIIMASIDYYGFAYETGGFPISLPGDELVFEGVADFLTPEFEVDLSEVELTFHVYGLISVGEIDMGDGQVMINYTGGVMEAYVDPAMNADWSLVMPETVGPSTFNDGDLFFRGEFNDFMIMMSSAGDGFFEGNLNGLEGQALGEPCEAYTWGGAFTVGAGAQIPQGYQLQMDGEFEIDSALPSQQTTWGQLKSLYR